MKHTDQPGFSKAKFTPTVIRNKKLINGAELKAYFLDGHTLGDCARKFGCAEVTIKRHLRANGVDTAFYNQSALARGRRSHVYNLSDDDLRRLFVDENLDSKTIAEMHDPPVHFNVIRKHLRRLGLRKDRQTIARSMSARHLRKHGYRHPAQRPDVLEKTRRGWTMVEYVASDGRSCRFKSLYELYYALLLDQRGLEWYYEEMRVPYIDALTGKQRIYVIDFTVVHQDGSIEWVEIKPAEGMIPSDKRLFAMRRAEEAGVIYRGNSAVERQSALEVFESGYRLEHYTFLRWKPHHDASTVRYCCKNEASAKKVRLRGWCRISLVKKCEHLYVVRLRRKT